MIMHLPVRLPSAGKRSPRRTATRRHHLSLVCVAVFLLGIGSTKAFLEFDERGLEGADVIDAELKPMRLQERLAGTSRSGTGRRDLKGDKISKAPSHPGSPKSPKAIKSKKGKKGTKGSKFSPAPAVVIPPPLPTSTPVAALPRFPTHPPTRPPVIKFPTKLPTRPPVIPSLPPTRVPSARLPTPLPTRPPTKPPTRPPILPTKPPTRPPILPTKPPTRPPILPTKPPTRPPSTRVPTPLPTRPPSRPPSRPPVLRLPTLLPTQVPPVRVPTPLPTRPPTPLPTRPPTPFPTFLDTPPLASVPDDAGVSTETGAGPSEHAVPTGETQTPPVSNTTFFVFHASKSKKGGSKSKTMDPASKVGDGLARRRRGLRFF